MKKYSEYSKQQELERMKIEFSPLPYRDRERTLYQVATGMSYFTQALSIITAFAMPFLAIGNIMPESIGLFRWAIAGVVSAVTLIALEVSLRNQLTGCIIEYLRDGNRDRSRLTVISAMLLLSLCSSMLGARMAAEAIDTSAHRVTLTYQSDTASIRATYKAEIMRIEAALNDYKESVSYKGKINIENAANKEAIRSYAAQLDRTNQDLHTALAQRYTAYTAAHNAAIKNSDTISLQVLAFAGINVCVFIFLILFQYKYKFNVLLESGQLPNTATSSPQPDEYTPTALQLAPSAKRTGFVIKGTTDLNTTYEDRPLYGNRTKENGQSNGERFIKTVSVPPIVPATVPSTHEAAQAPPQHTGTGFNITCQQCGKPSLKHSPKAKFCSDACRMNYHKTH
jgi:hypothetical protein